MSGAAKIAKAVTEAQAVLDLVALKLRTGEPLRADQAFTLFAAVNVAIEHLDAVHDVLQTSVSAGAPATAHTSDSPL